MSILKVRNSYFQGTYLVPGGVGASMLKDLDTAPTPKQPRSFK